MVQKANEPIIDQIKINFKIDQEFIKTIFRGLAVFSDKIVLKSNDYEYDSIDDFLKNEGLFDYSDWVSTNYGSKTHEAMRVQAYNLLTTCGLIREAAKATGLHPARVWATLVRITGCTSKPLRLDDSPNGQKVIVPEQMDCISDFAKKTMAGLCDS